MRAIMSRLRQNYRSIRSVDESAREIHSTTRAVSRIANSVRLDCLDHNFRAGTSPCPRSQNRFR
jgi:hypothetical protein